jgi:hypothetical protein
VEAVDGIVSSLAEQQVKVGRQAEHRLIFAHRVAGVNDTERYEFDRLGYLVLPEILSAGEVTSLREASDWLIDRALGQLEDEDGRRRGIRLGETDTVHDAEYAYTASLGPRGQGPDRYGETLYVGGFLNANPAFDVLVDHPATMAIIRDVIQGPIGIMNLELRVRWKGNSTVAHFGGPAEHLYRYSFNPDGIDCVMVRMVYFLHPVTAEQGAFSVVPCTHKSNYRSPYTDITVDDEPGMIGLDVGTGDAIFFTENLRHGGLTNNSDQPRISLHVGYGPSWMIYLSTGNPKHGFYVPPSTLERLEPEQRRLFEPPGL